MIRDLLDDLAKLFAIALLLVGVMHAGQFIEAAILIARGVQP